MPAPIFARHDRSHRLTGRQEGRHNRSSENPEAGKFERNAKGVVEWGFNWRSPSREFRENSGGREMQGPMIEHNARREKLRRWVVRRRDSERTPERVLGFSHGEMKPFSCGVS